MEIFFYICYVSVLYFITRHRIYCALCLGFELFLLCYFPFSISRSIFFLYLECLLFQDAKSYYIGPEWILPTVMLLLIYFNFFPVSILGACMFGVPCFVLYRVKSNWLGSADVIYFFIFGGILGVERMLVAVSIALICGFVWLLIKPNSLVPFCSCLSVGVMISILKGYTLWYTLMDYML